MLATILCAIALTPSASSFDFIPQRGLGDTAKKKPRNFDWSLTAQKKFARRRLKPSAWDEDLLALDIKQNYAYPGDCYSMRYAPAPTVDCYSMRYAPAPTVDYYSTGSAGSRPLRIGEAAIMCSSVKWARHDFNTHLCGKNRDYNYCNVLILKGIHEGWIDRGLSMNSRSYPHIQAGGYLVTAVGDVSWHFTGYATGDHYLNINRHIFDMKFGRTVLVAPQVDGSLRFMQLESPESSSGGGSDPLNDFFRGLKNNTEVVEFFNSPTAISPSTEKRPVERSRQGLLRQLRTTIDDHERLHLFLAGLSAEESGGFAKFLGQEDARLRDTLLNSIEKFGYPDPKRLGLTEDPVLSILADPPHKCTVREATLYLQRFDRVLKAVLRKDVKKAADYAHFNLTYTPVLSAEAFAVTYDRFLVRYLDRRPVYGESVIEGAKPIPLTMLAETNAARKEIGLKPIRAQDLRRR